MFRVLLGRPGRFSLLRFLYVPPTHLFLQEFKFARHGASRASHGPNSNLQASAVGWFFSVKILFFRKLPTFGGKFTGKNRIKKRFWPIRVRTRDPQTSER